MSNVLNAIKLTQRIRRAEAKERRHQPLPAEVASQCRDLLKDAEALGLNLHDVIDALRRNSRSLPSSRSMAGGVDRAFEAVRDVEA